MGETNGNYNNVIKGDAWFGSVKTVANIKQKAVMESVMQIKNNHALFLKEFIKDALEGGPGVVHIVLKGVHPNGTKLIAIGYHYSSKTSLFFVMSENAGSTTPGEPYEMKFQDEFGNIQIRRVDRPDVLSKFFRDSNSVDKHNQGRQHYLALEKHWHTTDCYFRLCTTMVGINVTDTWKLLKHHHLVPSRHVNCGVEEMDEDENEKYCVREFSGVLADQLASYGKYIEKSERDRQIQRLQTVHELEEVSTGKCVCYTDLNNHKHSVGYYGYTTQKRQTRSTE